MATPNQKARKFHKKQVERIDKSNAPSKDKNASKQAAKINLRGNLGKLPRKPRKTVKPKSNSK